MLLRSNGTRCTRAEFALTHGWLEQSVVRYRATAGIAAVILVLATVLLAACAQPKVYRVGWLLAAPSSSTPTREALKIFERGLRDLGHVEGKNVVVEYHFADRGPGQLPALAAELVKRNVDVIVTDGSQATVAARAATSTIPIVMAVSASPVEQGFVKSLARPGGNITGLSMQIPELARKRLELVKELAPAATRVAVLGRGADPIAREGFEETKAAAMLLKLDLVPLEVLLATEAPDYAGAFGSAARARADVLVTLPDAIFARDRAQIVALAAGHRLPVVYFERMFTEAGGLMSYGPPVADMFRRSASYVDKILRGAKPADLPVEQPTDFELFLNSDTAQDLGIKFPEALWSRADGRVSRK
jgi:putative ABC transport system substrate-binding protein